MPQRTWSQLIAAGATYEPLSGWQYEYVPRGAVLSILHRATAVGLVATITSGSDTLVEEGPVPAGGTAGFIPSANDVPMLSDETAAGDRLKVRYRNPTGGGITVDGIADLKF